MTPLCACGCGMHLKENRYPGSVSILGHSRRGKPYPRRPILDRFWEKVNKNGPLPDAYPSLGSCWIWTSIIRPRRWGYGVFTLDGECAPYKPGKKMLAHRFSYQLEFGEIPPGMFICHRCDNPPCVNPEHLFLGTPKDNTHDSIRKGRFLEGDRHPASKVSDIGVGIMRCLADIGVSVRATATMFGISRAQAYRIIRGELRRGPGFIPAPSRYRDRDREKPKSKLELVK